MPTTHRSTTPYRSPATGLAVVLLAGGLLLGTGHPASAASAVSAATAASGTQEPGTAASFAANINDERASNHRPRLAISSALTAAAESWAASMARSNTLEHNPRLSSEVSGWQYLGENVGVGYSASQLESAFWDSPGHRSNILDLDFTRVGVGVVDVGGKLWVAEEFERPYGASSAGAAPRRPAARTGSHSHPARAASDEAAATTGLPWPDRMPLGQWVVLPAIERPMAALDPLAVFPLDPLALAGS
jgi:Cysteine-rich secretory protein family